jgi:hypothetical protein
LNFIKIHNEKLHLYTSRNITEVIKLRSMRWAGHVAHMGVLKNAHKILVGKPDGKRPLTTPR